MKTSVITLIYTFIVLDTTASHEYAVSCLPAHNVAQPSYSGCEVIITPANSTATVTLSSAGGSETFTVPAGTSYAYGIGEHLFPEGGVEQKGVVITSDEHIHVLVHKQSPDLFDTYGDTFIDAYEAHESTQLGTHYFGLSSVSSACVSANFANQFFVVVATQNDTRLSIGKNGVVVKEVDLDEYSTYTEVTGFSGEDIVTGLEIRSTSNVSVIAGELCHGYADQDLSSVFSSLLPVERYGTKYTLPPVVANEESGYLINVIASEDNTTITIGENNYNLNRAENVSIGFEDQRAVMHVQCSNACYVGQFALGVPAVKGSFMMDIIPTESYYTSVHFSTVSQYESPVYMSVIVDGEAPTEEDNVYLDGEGLHELEWKREGAATSAITAISQGSHHVLTDGKMIAVYIFSTIFEDLVHCGGYGYSVHG